jgi:hypothetical protein
LNSYLTLQQLHHAPNSFPATALNEKAVVRVANELSAEKHLKEHNMIR